MEMRRELIVVRELEPDHIRAAGTVGIAVEGSNLDPWLESGWLNWRPGELVRGHYDVGLRLHRGLPGQQDREYDKRRCNDGTALEHSHDLPPAWDTMRKHHQ